MLKFKKLLISAITLNLFIPIFIFNANASTAHPMENIGDPTRTNT